MRKLLNSGFYRLVRDKVFWGILIFLAVLSIAMGWSAWQNASRFPEEQYFMEDVMFKMQPFFGFLCAVVVSLRLGTEFDEHTIRNKLVVGCSRHQVYFSEYLTCLAACEAMMIVMMVVSGLCGWLLFKDSSLGWSGIAYTLLCCILMTAVYSTICVGVAMNVHGRTAAVLVSIGVIFALLLAASFCNSALLESPMSYSSVTISMDGIEYGELGPNPAYVEGIQRTIYEYIYDGLPTGQSIHMNQLDFERWTRWPLLSLALLAVLTPVCYLPFRKRDIK